MLQYQLRVRRQWECPNCSRILRTLGSVTTKECSCQDPPLRMRLKENPAVAAFDAASFVSYDSDEYLDPPEPEETLPAPSETDAETDATVSDQESATEEAADAVVQIQSTSDTQTVLPNDDDDFAAGLETDHATDSPNHVHESAGAIRELPATAPRKQPVDNTANDTTSRHTDGVPNEPRGRRKRKRRRGRNSKQSRSAVDARTDSAPESNGPLSTSSDEKQVSDVTSPSSATAPETVSGGSESSGSAAESSAENDSAASRPRPRGKRRSRRRRKKPGSSE